nr:hypothetical protein [Agromyces marinus]
MPGCRSPCTQRGAPVQAGAASASRQCAASAAASVAATRSRRPDAIRWGTTSARDASGTPRNGLWGASAGAGRPSVTITSASGSARSRRMIGSTDVAAAPSNHGVMLHG